MTDSKRELMEKLKSMDDGDFDATYERIISFILAREQTMLSEVIECIKYQKDGCGCDGVELCRYCRKAEATIARVQGEGVSDE